MALFEAQPATKIYAFDRGWRVLKYVWENIFKKTGTSAGWWFSKAAEQSKNASKTSNTIGKYWQLCIAVGLWIGGASQYVSALFVAASFASLQTLFLTIWAGIAWLFIGILMGGIFLYSRAYRLFSRCYGCHEEMPIPTFLCSNPSCLQPHTRLWPSIYGVFHHKCKCGTKLPTLEILGRKKLVRRCPNCGRPLSTEVGGVPPVHVAIAGGPSTGKTNFIVMATRELKERYAMEHGYQIGFPNQQDEQNFASNLGLLGSGRELLKTTDLIPSAYNLRIEAPHSQIVKKLTPKAGLAKLAYIYDAAGEVYGGQGAQAGLHQYYGYMDGLIFVVDPFAIPEFRARHQNEIEQLKMALRPSSLDVEDAYARMQEMLATAFGIKPEARTHQPLAVVLTKVDALGLENQIGAPAARELMAQNPSICLEDDAINILVRRFLAEEYGLDNFIRSVEAQFTNVKYFSCSALGRLPDTADQGSFTPIRAVNPFVWVLGYSRTVNAFAERKALVDARHRAMMKGIGKRFQGYRYYYWNSLKPRRLERSA